MSDPWDPEICDYNRTVTGWLGRKRPSMLSNVLLARGAVGKATTLGASNRLEDKTFGMLSTDRTKTVRQALEGWGLVNVPDDHLTTNRALLKKRVHRGKDYDLKEEFERPPTPTMKLNQTYGIRPEYYKETITDLLNYKYQKEFLEETKKGNKCFKDAFRAAQEKEKALVKSGLVYENRACQLRKSARFDPVESGEPWRMRRFLNVEPHLCTFRNQKAMEKARKADALEGVGRDGIWGHGISTKAKTLV